MDPLHLLGLNISETKEAFNYSTVFMERPESEHYELNRIIKHTSFQKQYWFLSFVAVAIYLPTIYGIKAYMAKRKPFVLRTELFLWNSALGIFSAYAVSQMLPVFVGVISRSGFQNMICEWSVYPIDILPFWILMFVYSKYVELGDTIFIVLRKKPLVFLQWYHHCITLVYCWTVGPLVEPINVFFSLINYGVHSLMYPYFAVKSLGYNPPRWVASIITTCQLIQMLAVFAINIYSLYLIRSGVPCRRFAISIYFNFFMFATFIFMFGKLFVDVVKKSLVTSKKLRAD